MYLRRIGRSSIIDGRANGSADLTTAEIASLGTRDGTTPSFHRTHRQAPSMQPLLPQGIPVRRLFCVLRRWYAQGLALRRIVEGGCRSPCPILLHRAQVDEADERGAPSKTSSIPSDDHLAHLRFIFLITMSRVF